MGTGELGQFVTDCRTLGSEWPAPEFAHAIRRLGNEIVGDWQAEDLDGHLDLLIEKGDRLSAALLILPHNWGYVIRRTTNGTVYAAIEPPARGMQEEMAANEEGAALIGAIAASLAGGPTPLR